MNRTTFLVDVFNLYHSVKEAGKDLGVPTKWLDLRSLLSFYLPVRCANDSANTLVVETDEL